MTSGGLSLARAAEFVARRPDTAVAWLLGAHVVLWSLVPLLLSANLQLDLAEDLALGKEWQLGYWKHPPLPWWIADLAYRITGQIGAVYWLGPLASVACIYVVWRFARGLVGPLPAFVVVAALEGMHFFNYSAVKFSHDQMQLPFWALTGFFTYRAIAGGKLYDWSLGGAMMALAFWSKYAAFVLGMTIALVLVFDPDARRRWRTAGPYAMAVSFLLVMSPNLWWLARYDFLPFRYVDLRAEVAHRWYQYVTFQFEWIVSQIFFVLPSIIILGVLFVGAGLRRRGGIEPFTRRFLAALALGPFLVTTVSAAVLGRSPVPMWGYSLWIFAPLAVLVWFEPAYSGARLRRLVAVVTAVFVSFLASYATIERFGPLVRSRPVASHFPGAELAGIVTAEWRKRTGMPLRYVSGTADGFGPGEFAANNVAVYSPDRPRVIVHGDFRLSPWIAPDDVRRHGAVVVWQPTRSGRELPPGLMETFPNLEVQPRLTLKSASPFARQPVLVDYAFVPPQGAR
ncbi:MAG: glycosyltransferase family 39 protein [Pseudolabrys sp.]